MYSVLICLNQAETDATVRSGQVTPTTIDLTTKTTARVLPKRRSRVFSIAECWANV